MYWDYRFNNEGNVDFSKDPSVAAFMETAVNQCRFVGANRSRGCPSASGITEEGSWYSVWNIKDIKGTPNTEGDPTDTGYYIVKN